MVKVYFETPNNSYAERVATFKTEELYIACLPILEAEAKKQNFIVTESIEETEIKKDLFEFYEEQPEELKEVLRKYGNFEELDYEELKSMRAECKNIGFTFDFYLDAQAHNLRKL
jgi:hypothetical protein